MDLIYILSSRLSSWFKPFVLMVFMGGLSVPSQGQYCAPIHHYGCTYLDTNLGFAAIETVVLRDKYLNQLINKDSDGCNDKSADTSSGHHNLISHVAPSMEFGQRYYLLVAGSHPNGDTVEKIVLGVWIDLNMDEDFDDKGEFFGNHLALDFNQIRYSQGIELNLPCGIQTGKSRIRIRSNIASDTFSSNEACATLTKGYGETEDFIVNLRGPQPIKADFSVPDTGYIDTDVELINKNLNSLYTNIWYLDTIGAFSAGINGYYIFDTTGNRCVKLVTSNCYYSDSITKCLPVVKPSAPPVADFKVVEREVDLFTTVQLRDQSTNGPNSWVWKIFDSRDSAATVWVTPPPPSKPSSYIPYKHPDIFTAKGIPGFLDIGTYSVCLTSSNAIGSSRELCKYDYFKVSPNCDEIEMGAGTDSKYLYNIIVCDSGSLINSQDWRGNYSTPVKDENAMISPCGANEIYLQFDYFKVKEGAVLQIYDGTDTSGKPLHTDIGFTASNLPKGTFTAYSGAVFVRWSSVGDKNDKGFKISWASKSSGPGLAKAKFESYDTLFTAVPTTFLNKSENIRGVSEFMWSINKTSVSTSKNLETSFFSNGQHELCLTVKNCISSRDTTCKKITVLSARSPSPLILNASNRRPYEGEKIELSASSRTANSYRWKISKPSQWSYVDGTDSSSAKPIIQFHSLGEFDVALTAWNYVDSARTVTSETQSKFIIVREYCKPSTKISSNLLAINNVIIEDTLNKDTLMVNRSGHSMYSDYKKSVYPATMFFGNKYQLAVKRDSIQNSANIKAWIDFNGDGEFDSTELVLHSKNSKRRVATEEFTVPSIDKSFEGTAVLRIGISFGDDPNEPCGVSSGVPNANRLGEFEDYSINLTKDDDHPSLSLLGAETICIQEGSPYTDAGATAHDPTTGDISAQIVVNSNVNTSVEGTYLVIYNVADPSDNKADQVERVVHVVKDLTPPVLKLKGDSVVIVHVNDTAFIEPGYTANDNIDGNLTSQVLQSGKVILDSLGSYLITYCVSDRGSQKCGSNTSCETRRVLVKDTVPPTITNIDADMRGGCFVVEIQVNSIFVDKTVFSDNYDSVFYTKVTPGGCCFTTIDTRKFGRTEVKYFARDNSGNADSITICYLVEDYIAPVINLNTADTVYHPVNTPYTPVAVSVSDNYYDSTQISLSASSAVDPYTLGVYMDTYTATDGSGNVAVKKRLVHVVDTTRPEIYFVPGNRLCVGPGSKLDLFNYVKARDNYDAPDSVEQNIWLHATDLNTDLEGVYVAYFLTKDQSNNVSDTAILTIEVDSNCQKVNPSRHLSKKTLELWPHPSDGIVHLRLPGSIIDQTQLRLANSTGQNIDLNGRISSREMEESLTLDLRHLKPGVYYLRLRHQGVYYSMRLILVE